MSRNTSELENTPAPTFTFIGAGQVTAALLANLTLGNRAEQDPSKRVKISILESYLPTIEDWKTNGIRVEMEGKKMVHVKPDEFFITSNPGEIPKNQTAVIVATKTTAHNEEMKKTLGGFIGENTELILAQNGVSFCMSPVLGIEELESASYPLAEIDNCSVSAINLACTRTVSAEGVVVYHLTTPRSKIAFQFGKPSGIETDRTLLIRNIFSKAGVKTRLTTEIGEEATISEIIAQKLQFNAIFNSICTISGKTIGEIMDPDQPLLFLVIEAVNEIKKLFTEECGIKKLRNPEQMAERSKASAAHKTSMHGDFQNGFELENKAIVDALVEIAAKKGVTLNSLESLSDILQKMITDRDKSIKSGKSANEAAEESRKNHQSELYALAESAKRETQSSPETQELLKKLIHEKVMKAMSNDIKMEYQAFKGELPKTEVRCPRYPTSLLGDTQTQRA